MDLDWVDVWILLKHGDIPASYVIVYQRVDDIYLNQYKSCSPPTKISPQKTPPTSHPNIPTTWTQPTKPLPADTQKTTT